MSICTELYVSIWFVAVADDFDFAEAKLQVTSPGGSGTVCFVHWYMLLCITCMFFAGPMDAEEREEFKRVHGAIEKSFCFGSR